MPVIPTLVWDKYRELSALFITEVNKTTITLYFNQDNVTTVSNPNNFLPPSLDMYGGRSPIAAMDGRSQESSGPVRETIIPEDILVRLYWINSKVYDTAKQIEVINSKNTAKIICYARDANKLQNAQYISVTNEGVVRKLIMTIPPVFYGMGGIKSYAISYWEESNG